MPFVQPCGSWAPHLPAGKECRWPNICLKHFAVSFKNFRNKELKGGSGIAFWWLKVSRWNCQSKRWGSWESLWNIYIADTEKVERDKNKFKMLDLIKEYLIALGYWYWCCVKAREKTFKNWQFPGDFLARPQTLAVLMRRSAKPWTLQGLKPQVGIVQKVESRSNG